MAVVLFTAVTLAGCGGGKRAKAPATGLATPTLSSQTPASSPSSPNSPASPLSNSGSPASSPTSDLAQAGVKLVDDPVYGRVVAGQVLVVLPENARTAQDASRLASELGLSVVDSFEEVGVQVLTDGSQDAPSAILSRLNRPDLKAGPNAVLKLSGTFNDPALTAVANNDRWGLEKMQAFPLMQDAGFDKVSATVALLDTGVEATHPELSGQVVAGPNFVDEGSSLSDPHGHGTALAGLIAGLAGNGLGAAGVCAGCKVQSIRVCNGQGECPTAAVIAGLATVASEKKARVVNLSVNVTPRESFTKDLLGNVTGLLASQGVLVVASAGNDGKDAAGVLPNGVTGVLTVGATNAQDSLTSESNFGPLVDLYAPGESLLAPDRAQGFLYVKGTSAASALVAGAAAALVAERPALTPSQIEDAFKTTASQVVGQTGGRLNLQLARNTFASLNIPPSVGVDLSGAVSEAGTFEAVVSVRDGNGDAASVVITHGLKGETLQTENRTLALGMKEAVYKLTLAAPKNGVVAVSATATDDKGGVGSGGAERSFETVVLSDLVLESNAVVAPVGSTVLFTVKAKKSDGALEDVTGKASFTVTPQGGLTPVPGGPAGAFYALVMGGVTVKAAYGGLSKELAITVSAANTGDVFHVSAGDTGSFTAPTTWVEYLRDSYNSNDPTSAVGQEALVPPLVVKWQRAIGSEGVTAPNLTQAGFAYFGVVNNEYYKVSTTDGLDQGASPSFEGSTPGANAIITSLNRLHYGFPLGTFERVMDLDLNAIGSAPNGPDQDDWYNRDSNGSTAPDNIAGPISIASIGNGGHIYIGAGTAGNKFLASIDTGTTPGTVRWMCNVAGQVFSVPMFYNNGSENLVIAGVAVGSEKYVVAVDTDGQSDGDANSAFEAGTMAATLESLPESTGCDVVWSYPLGKDETSAPTADPPGGVTDESAGSMGAQAIIKGGRLYFGVTAKNSTHRGGLFAIDPNDGNTLGTLHPAFDSAHSNAVWKRTKTAGTNLDGCAFSTPTTANVGGTEMLFLGTGTSSAVNASFCSGDVGRTLYGIDAATGATLWSNQNGLVSSSPTTSNYFHAPLKYTTGTVVPGGGDNSGIVWAHAKSNLLAFDADPSDNGDAGALDAGGASKDLVWRFLATSNEAQGLTVPGIRSGKLITNLANNAYAFASPIKPPVLTGAPSVDCGTNDITLTWSIPTQNLDGTAVTDLAGFNVYRGSGVTIAAASTAGFTRIADTGTLGATATTFTDTTAVSGTTYYYVVTSVDTAGNDTVFWQYSGPTASGGYSTANNRNQYNSRLYRDPTAAYATTTNIRFDETANVWSSGTAPAFGSLSDGEATIAADCLRPAQPTGFGATLQCPNMVFNWTAPTQDDADSNSTGDSPLTGLVGYNVYSSSSGIGSLDPYLVNPLQSLTPINGASPTNLIAAITYSLNPRANIAAANYAVTAHDNANSAQDQNESFSSAQVNFAYACQPTGNLSASFVYAQCATSNPIQLTWDDVDDNGTYRVYRKVGSSTPYPVPVPHGGADAPISTTANLGGVGTVTFNVDYSGTDQAQEYYYVTVWDGGTEETDPVLLNSTAVVPDCNPPAAPTAVSASDVTNDEGIGSLPSGVVSVTWTLSTDDGGGGNDVTEYRIYRALASGGPYTQIGTVSAGVTVYSDNLGDLAVGQQVESAPYYYVVRAWDSVNESGDSNEGSATVVDNDGPNSVTTVNSAMTCPATAVVTWTAPTLNDDGEALPDLNGFNIYRNVNNAAFATATLVTSVSAATLTYSDSTTASGNTYYYFIEPYDDRAASAGGPNSGSVVAGSSTSILNGCLPQPPQNVAAANVDPDEGGQINVTWDQSISDDGVSFAALQYEVYRRTASPISGSFALVTTIAATTAASYSYVDDDGGALLAEATTYEYKVLAVDGAFSSNDSNYDQAQPLDEAAPAAPTLQTVAQNCPDIDITWTRPTLNHLGAALNDLSGYFVYRSINGSAYSISATVADPGAGLTVTYTDDPAAGYPAEGYTYSYKIVAFDDAEPPATGDNTSSESAVLSVYKQCTEQPNAPTVTKVCNTTPTPNTMTVEFMSGPNSASVPITTFSIEVASNAGGPWSATTPATVAYAGANTSHSVSVDYPTPDGTYYYRVTANIDYGGGVTMTSTPSNATSAAANCYSFSEEPSDPNNPPDCGYSGNPWYASTDPTLMATPQDVTVANDAGAGGYQTYANDNLKRLVFVFDAQCLAPGTPTKFGIINNTEGQTGNFVGTYGMARTNFSNFGTGGGAETLLVSRNYGTTGYLYKCTTAGVCTLDIQSGGYNIYGIALEVGPTHNFIYLAQKGRIAKYAYAGATSRTAVASRAASSPFGIDTDGAGNVYYSDLVANQIIVLDSNLTGVVRTIGSAGTSPGQFQQPYGVHVMKTKDRIFVADKNNHRIQLLNSLTGAAISTIGSFGYCIPGGACQQGVLYEPRGVHVIEDTTSARFEYMAVADTLNHRVQFYLPPASGF